MRTLGVSYHPDPASVIDKLLADSALFKKQSQLLNFFKIN